MIELGCGLGLCGTVASVLIGTSGNVTCTDGDVSVVARAQTCSNILADDATISYSVLAWGDVAAAEHLRETAGMPFVRV